MNSDQTNSEEQKKKRPGLLSRIVTFPVRISFAARVAWLLFVFLVLLVVIAWLVFLLGPAHVPWRHSMTWSRILAVIGLTLIVPIIVYRALRLWLDGESSPFSDIDYAWKAGLVALEEHGLRIDSVPVFLVLGVSGPLQERAIVEATGLSLRVHAVPEGPAPIHWYANQEGVYIFCSGTGWLSALAVQHEKAITRDTETGSSLRRTLADTPPPRTSEAPSQSTSPTQRGTLMLDRYEGGQVTDAAATESSSATESLQPGHGTLMLQSLAVEDVAPSSADISERVDRQSLSALVPAQTAAREAHRLRYLCQLVRRARQPLCPVNGVMTLLDSQLIQANARDIDELQEAIKTDLGTIEYECGLRFPVTALIVGMEKERGFRELIRRVGREQSASQRFGQRFDLRSAANSDVLSAFTSHVCGVFEDWVYTLFRDEATLTRPGNTHLYGLLCKIRFHLNDRLNSILAGGFGHNETQNRDGRAIIFSGCYFAATGATQDRQAFVSGAFDKLVEEQEEIEWTPTASRQNRRCKRLAKASWAVCGVLVLCLGTMLVYEFMWRR